MNSKNFALITGASSGIGEACAYALADKKKNLILVARRKVRLNKIKKHIEKKHKINVLVYEVNLSNFVEIDLLFQEIRQKEIDVLINNAGLALGKTSFENCEIEDFNQMIDVNIKAFLTVAKLAIPKLKETQGHIINISSVAGIEAYEGGSVYCGTKAFVRMISRALRIDLAGTGIRVTDIAPGAVKTEFSDVRFKGDKKSANQVYEGFTPLDARDIAEAVLFALNRPKSVNIDYLLMMPTAQASATRIIKCNNN